MRPVSLLGQGRILYRPQDWQYNGVRQIARLSAMQDAFYCRRH
jgi:hypothetical protein